MDRGYNRNSNYLSKRAYILKQAERANLLLLPNALPSQVQEITEAIHTHQFKLLLQKTHTCTEVDIAGLGSYNLTLSASKKYLKKLTKRQEWLKKQNQLDPYIQDQLAQCNKDYALLSDKINQHNEFKDFKRVYKADAKRDKELKTNPEISNNQLPDGASNPTTGSD